MSLQVTAQAGRLVTQSDSQKTMQAPQHQIVRRPQRPTCNRCQRPQTSCICRWTTPTAHAAEVLILQHPLEVRDAKNSARLLHLSLPGSRIVVARRLMMLRWRHCCRSLRTPCCCTRPPRTQGMRPLCR